MTRDDMLKLARECAAEQWEAAIDLPVCPDLRDGKMDHVMEVQSALAAIRIMHERGEKLAGALEPFAKAAMGITAHDPDFPDDGAALRASFDWYDKIQDEPLKRNSVRKRDIDNAQAALTEWRNP